MNLLRPCHRSNTPQYRDNYDQIIWIGPPAKQQNKPIPDYGQDRERAVTGPLRASIDPNVDPWMQTR